MKEMAPLASRNEYILARHEQLFSSLCYSFISLSVFVKLYPSFGYLSMHMLRRNVRAQAGDLVLVAKGERYREELKKKVNRHILCGGKNVFIPNWGKQTRCAMVA